MDPLIIHLPVSACSIYVLTYLVKSLLTLAARVATHQARPCQLAGAAQHAGHFDPSACSSKLEVSSASAAASCVNVGSVDFDDVPAPLKCDDKDVAMDAEGPCAELVECVFCLCDVEEGEESREISCGHVFHRGCLGRWVVMHARATCPLCRGALVPDEATTEAAAAAKHEGVDGDAEVDDWRIIVAAFFGSRWLANCATLVSNMYVQQL